jgi:hypothetical protein
MLDVILRPRFEVSFALLLIVIGLVSLAAMLKRPDGRKTRQKEQ